MNLAILPPSSLQFYYNMKLRVFCGLSGLWPVQCNDYSVWIMWCMDCVMYGLCGVWIV